MKEQVLDMSEFLKAVNEKIDGLTNRLDIALKENVVLRQRIVVLEVRLAKYETPKDCHNSSTPPSKESIKYQLNL